MQDLATEKVRPVDRSGYVPGGWLRIAIWAGIVIAVAAVLRRMYALAHPATSGPPELIGLDAQFSSHAALTLAHIVPALCFVLLVPLVIFRRPDAHAWAERLLFPIGAIVGLTAYAMSGYSVGGWVERSAVLLFNTLFLYCLFRAYVGRRDNLLSRRRWLFRAIMILLGIATTRPVMGIFFATSRLTHLRPSEFFGIAFWIGFSINTIAAELWLRSRGSRFTQAA